MGATTRRLPAIPLATNQSFPSLFSPTQIGPDLTWVVNLNSAGLTYGAAQATIAGTLHVTDPDQDFAGDRQGHRFTITNPSISIDKIGSITERAGAAERHVHVRR